MELVLGPFQGRRVRRGTALVTISRQATRHRKQRQEGENSSLFSPTSLHACRHVHFAFSGEMKQNIQLRKVFVAAKFRRETRLSHADASHGVANRQRKKARVARARLSFFEAFFACHSEIRQNAALMNFRCGEITTRSQGLARTHVTENKRAKTQGLARDIITYHIALRRASEKKGR